ncbi:PhnD/SsuA/transferrin family substrate-binding protein [Aeoliella sp. ICT_H6.2]|uniref:PhnD/SsuA/transferrin family substrate-binding protein n=1 Tax=Aeoliella straminimaris TaxID=2954799 RepID=A0A9X2FD09_9BACT|nr:PhnD/SsuA/transferrin family substrate-binding protein [Aeoliella straminimaris]MCO6046695.1 PhnD/SsuA/transferrin family substrate-binding protein [Aeoliella straminimaris]
MRFACLAILALVPLCVAPPATADEPAPLNMVVMDPLAAPLSCPCVEGYAQRKYEELAKYLTKKLGREVKVAFGESVARGMEKGEFDEVHIVIGKDSVVRADAAKLKVKAVPVAQLTGKDGSTTQTGLVVVRSSDSAKKVSDLSGYRILYGPQECDEKFAAPRDLLAAAGIDVVAAEQAETSAACSDGACKIIEWGDSQNAAAVISSYAAPLLEGCGTINKGDLRVVGETKPVPFVTAFVNGSLADDEQQEVRETLLDVMYEPELLLSLETLKGFVPLTKEYKDKYKKSKDAPPAGEKLGVLPVSGLEDRGPPDGGPPGAGPQVVAANSSPEQEATLGWTGWRGPHRDGRVRALPTRLPEKLPQVWQVPLAHSGLGGIAATDKYVVIGDRNLPNTGDEFRCYDAATGNLLWIVDYPAEGALDYDNTPRATPLIVAGEDELLGPRVILQGAFGHLSCVDLATGIIYWQKNIRDEFGADSELVWGTCSSPLVVDGKLIVTPGAPEASIAALDLMTGLALWQTPGETSGYGSLIVATLGGKRQIVGHDRVSLGGWDVETGERLWTLKPPRSGDFNVPTPIEVDGKLLVTTEGNGTRLYAFDADGKIIPEPTALQMQLAPDMSTPVVVGSRLYCVCQQLYCLDLAGSLAELCELQDPALGDYAPIIADDKHLLILGHGGELLLIDISGESLTITSRTFLFDDPETREAELYSHPAIVGNRLYVRGETSLACFELQ